MSGANAKVLSTRCVLVIYALASFFVLAILLVSSAKTFDYVDPQFTVDAMQDFEEPLWKEPATKSKGPTNDSGIILKKGNATSMDINWKEIAKGRTNNTESLKQEAAKKSKPRDQVEELMELHNLSYPSHWRPKNTTELPNAEGFELPSGRLEFVHIPKTGGTMIESAAARAGISWSLCHFTPARNAFAMSVGETLCPGNVPLLRRGPPVSKIMPGWHLPPYYLQLEEYWKDNPYSNASLFCIVRNVYERLVSEYHYAVKYTYRLNDEKRNNVNRMNHFIKTQLESHQKSDKGDLSKGRMPASGYWQHSGHIIAQHDYVFDPRDGSQVIQHVIKFETMHEDLLQLFKKYGLNITLPAEDVRLGRKHAKGTTVANITDENIRLINSVYEKDFEAFGYEKILVGT